MPVATLTLLTIVFFFPPHWHENGGKQKLLKINILPCVSSFWFCFLPQVWGRIFFNSNSCSASLSGSASAQTLVHYSVWVCVCDWMVCTCVPAPLMFNSLKFELQNKKGTTRVCFNTTTPRRTDGNVFFSRNCCTTSVRRRVAGRKRYRPVPSVDGSRSLATVAWSASTGRRSSCRNCCPRTVPLCSETGSPSRCVGPPVPSCRAAWS